MRKITLSYDPDIFIEDDLKFLESIEARPRGTITITFGERVENHARMQMIGSLADSGFSIKELESAKSKFEDEGFACELVNLNELLSNNTVKNAEEAAILIVRNFLGTSTANKMLYENMRYDWDRRALMKGKVVNKKARWNVCIADEAQEPAYEDGKGRVVKFDDLPVTKNIREILPNYLGEKANNLNAEGNYYYDTKECYIGFHGDGERKKVVAIRLGESFPITYRWYQNTEPISEQFTTTLNHGDLYIMSEKAVGTDWLKKIIPTLRHAAGFPENINPKAKAKK